MDFSIVLSKYYDGFAWICGETYQTLKWLDDLPKPTEEELELKYDDLLLDEVREERNRLLKESDITVLTDYPSTNKEAWLSYREALRDFPSVWTPGMAFPEKPE
jgi:hypothetical protein